MSQKSRKKIILSIVLIVSIVFSRCQNDDVDLSNPQISNVSLAKKWFKEYESGSDNYALFENLNYEWESAEIKGGGNGDQLIVVPIVETKKDPNEVWEQKLYIYKLSDNNYKALLYEFYPRDYVIENVDSTKFNGYITTWDLKTGFVKSAKFVNDILIENGEVEVLSKDKAIVRSATAKVPQEADNGESSGRVGEILRPVLVQNNYIDSMYYLPNPRGTDVAPGNYGDYTSGYVGSGGSGGTNSSANKIVVIGPPKVISNVKEYLKCFDLSKSAELIIYVDQPNPNSSDAYTLTGDVGHTFIAIQQGAIRRVLGYWPSTSVNPAISPTDKMAFGNDENHFFDVSISNVVTSSQLVNIIDYCINKTPNVYNLNTYNCTDFGIAVAKLGGINFASSYGTWPNGGGNNPGQLGQNIRGMSVPVNGIKQTAGTNSASNKGTCN